MSLIQGSRWSLLQLRKLRSAVSASCSPLLPVPLPTLGWQLQPWALGAKQPSVPAQVRKRPARSITTTCVSKYSDTGK